MLVAHIAQPTTAEPLLSQQPALAKALEWIQAEGQHKEAGKYEIDGQNMFADIQEIDTQPRADRRFEAHKEYVDVQFCVSGGEIIEWAPVNTLEPQTEYDAAKDIQHYNKTPTPVTAILMTPGTVAIFFPGDAHMVKVTDNVNQSIKKVVVKVSTRLLT